MNEYKRNAFLEGMGVAGSFLIGAAVGVALGFLFAPKSGHELREDLLQSAGELSDQFVEAGNRIAHGVSAEVRRVGEKAEALGSRISERVEELRGEACEQL